MKSHPVTNCAPLLPVSSQFKLYYLNNDIKRGIVKQKVKSTIQREENGFSRTESLPTGKYGNKGVLGSTGWGWKPDQKGADSGRSHSQVDRSVEE